MAEAGENVTKGGNSINFLRPTVAIAIRTKQRLIAPQHAPGAHEIEIEALVVVRVLPVQLLLFGSRKVHTDFKIGFSQ